MRFLWLDLLRGIAASFVVMFHLIGQQSQFVGAGWLSVDFFFVLSGFVLSESIQLASNNGIESKLIFVKKRVLRLGPMLLLSLSFAFCVKIVELAHEHISGDIGDSRAFTLQTPLFFLMSIFLIQFAYPLAITVLIPLWSLSVEFYLNLLTVFLGLAKSQRRLSLGIILGICCIYFSGLRFDDSSDWTRYHTWLFGLGRALVGFNLGQIAWQISKSNHRINSLINLTSILFLVCAVALTWVHAKTYILLPSWFLFILITLTFSRYQNPNAGGIASRIFSFMGQTSFAVYLLHPSVFSLVTPSLKVSGFIRIPGIYFFVLLIAYSFEKFLAPCVKRELANLLKI